MAVGKAGADAKEFELIATHDSENFGIRSAPFLDDAFKTVEFRIRISIHPGGTWPYGEDTVLLIRGKTEPFLHTDKNTLTRIAEPNPTQPNPTQPNPTRWRATAPCNQHGASTLQLAFTARAYHRSKRLEDKYMFVFSPTHKAIFQNFPLRLAAVRQELQLTYEQLAEKTGIEALKLRRFESGDSQPALEDVRNIANALGLGIPDLLAPPQP